MSALPKPPSLLDPVFGKTVRQKIQWEERRLREVLNLSENKIEDIIGEIIKELVVALSHFDSQKGKWSTYAYRVIQRQLFHYETCGSKALRAERAECPFAGYEISSLWKKNEPTINKVERQQCLAIGVKRAMQQMRRDNREPIARIVVKDVKAAAHECHLAQIQLRRKMALMQSMLQAQDIDPSDAA